MTPDFILDIFRQAMTLVVLMVFILVIPGLAVGLLVAMFQAATQINEMSLSFIPKLFVTIIALGISGPWLLQLIINYTTTLMNDIPGFLM